MAYDCPVSCPRILYFSNPAVNYNAAPTGTVAQNNNALSINNARTTVANWRQQVVANTPPTITAVANQVIAEDTPTAALAFTVVMDRRRRQAWWSRPHRPIRRWCRTVARPSRSAALAPAAR